MGIREKPFIRIICNDKICNTSNDQCSLHIETNQLACSANQLPGFYMMGTLNLEKDSLNLLPICLL